jgi:hypothetical protein
MDKKSKSGRTVRNPTGTASYKNKSGQFNQATRAAVKGAKRNVVKSVAKGVAKKAGVFGAGLALAEDRGSESFKNLKELERGKMSKGLRKVKPLPADKPKAKAKPVPRPKRKPVSPKTKEFLRIKKTRIF